MNKFMKKIMSKKDGFTLVELIVVIAILAILAGVAVPAYSAYINSANEAADNQKLEAVETAMLAALAMEGKDEDDADDNFTLTFSTANNVNKVTVGKATDADEDVWKNFAAFYGSDYEVELDYYDAAGEVKVLNVTAQ